MDLLTLLGVIGLLAVRVTEKWQQNRCLNYKPRRSKHDLPDMPDL